MSPNSASNTPVSSAPTPNRSGESIGRRIALNRHTQRELYGAPLGERVRHLVEVLGITQARLARTLGMSPAMLSQLVSGRRVKIGDPAALARFQMIDYRCARITERPSDRAVDRLLAEVGQVRWRWIDPGPSTSLPAHTVPRPRAAPSSPGASCPAEVLRRVCSPAQLAAAAAILGAGFPELAEVLRRAAVRR